MGFNTSALNTTAVKEGKNADDHTRPEINGKSSVAREISLSEA